MAMARISIVLKNFRLFMPCCIAVVAFPIATTNPRSDIPGGRLWSKLKEENRTEITWVDCDNITKPGCVVNVFTPVSAVPVLPTIPYFLTNLPSKYISDAPF